jgi:hypothetical protein
MKMIHAVAAAILATVITTTVAEAQTTMYACYVKNTGTVYRIKTAGTPTKCSSNHTEFSWNLEGQVGPQGPQGPAGPSGITGVRQVFQTSTVGVNEPGVWVIWCDEGETVTGGGFNVYNPPSTGIEVLGNGPLMVQNPESIEYGFRVHIKNHSAAPVQVTASAICMKLAPQS